MKPVKLFYLKNCPFCRKALRYIEEAKAAHPELQPVAIEMIEESEQSDLADTFDYYYVPTFYVDGVRIKNTFNQCWVCGRLRYQFCKNNRLH